MKRYEFRRQFIVGTDFFGSEDYWYHILIKHNVRLSVHRDLPVHEAQKDGKKIILIGYILDPFNTDYTNSDIVKHLLNQSGSFSEVIENTYGLSGRWLLIFTQNNEIKLFHDPFGIRQIYYAEHNGELWCGSQPSILADNLNLKPEENNKDLEDFIYSPVFESKEGFWIGNKSRFQSIKHLLPNHYLDYVTNSVHRYWVNEEQNLSLHKASKLAGEILRGSLIAANKQFNLMMPITAGWDSRVLLSASKDIKDDVFYYISTKNILNSEDDDIKIPKRIFERLGLEFNVLDELEEPDEDFLQILRKNVNNARNSPKTLTLYEFYLNHQDKMNVNGLGGEIARCYYNYEEEEPTAEFLAKITGYPSSNYAISEIEEWLHEVRSFFGASSINIFDLYYWEQRIGNWGAMDQAEKDIAIREFCPFNNRKLLMILLSVDRKYRTLPNFRLFRNIIHYLWRDLLKEPFNPISIKEKIVLTFKNKMPYNLKKSIKNKLNIFPYN